MPHGTRNNEIWIHVMIRRFFFFSFQNALEQQLQELCLPFLRVASLLKHHLYHYDLPEITTTESEFVGLVNYLELVTNTTGRNVFNAAMALCFLEGNEKTLPKYWCYQLMEVQPPHEETRELILNQHVSWQQPRLLGLPREYEQLFTVRSIYTFVLFPLCDTNLCFRTISVLPWEVLLEM